MRVLDRSRMFPFPPSLLQAAASLLDRQEEASRLLGSLRVDSSAIRQALDWSPPYTLREALRATAGGYLAPRTERRAEPVAPPANVHGA